MLYDPKWEIVKVADPWSFERLAEWLARQARGERYCYSNVGHCLLAQYLDASGHKVFSVSPKRFSEIGQDGRLQYKNIPAEFNKIALHGRHTFGAALRRVRRKILWEKIKVFFR